MASTTISVDRPGFAAPRDAQTSTPIVDVQLPGSKSLTVRAVMLAALADGPSQLTGALRSDDTDALCNAVRNLGVDVSIDDDSLRIGGGGPGTPLCDVLDLGLGGAPSRFSLALAALADVPVTVDGAPRLRERPMHDAISLFTQLGVRIEPIGDGPGLPLRIEGGAWETHHLTIGATATSQVVSALLIAATRAGGLQVEFQQPPTSAAYLNLTIAELRRWGVHVEVQRRRGNLHRITVPSHPPVGGNYAIGRDASSAVVAACACCAVPGAVLSLPGATLDGAQPDIRALLLLRQAGADITPTDDGLRVSAPKELTFPDEVDASGMPDAVPSLAVIAACRGAATVRFTGLETLRVKECDRVQSTADLLRTAGGEALIEGDDLVVYGGIAPSRETMDALTCDDHRMAMAAAALGLWRGCVRIDDPGVVTKSWPGFWADLAGLGGWSATAAAAVGAGT